MDETRVEELLQRYAQTRAEERLFSKSGGDALRARLAKPDTDNHPLVDADEIELAAPLDPSSRPTGSTRRMWSVFMTIGAAAAAAIILAIPPPQMDRSAVELVADGAFDKLELFQTDRAASDSADDARYYLGVWLEREAFVRIIARFADGSLESVPLNCAGDRVLLVPAEQPYPFGGYPIRASSDEPRARDITHFVVVAHSRSIDNDTVADKLATIAERCRNLDDDTLAKRLAREFWVRLRTKAQVLTVPQP